LRSLRGARVGLAVELVLELLLELLLVLESVGAVLLLVAAGVLLVLLDDDVESVAAAPEVVLGVPEGMPCVVPGVVAPAELLGAVLLSLVCAKARPLATIRLAAAIPVIRLMNLLMPYLRLR